MYTWKWSRLLGFSAHLGFVVAFKTMLKLKVCIIKKVENSDCWETYSFQNNWEIWEEDKNKEHCRKKHNLIQHNKLKQRKLYPELVASCNTRLKTRLAYATNSEYHTGLEGKMTHICVSDGDGGGVSIGMSPEQRCRQQQVVNEVVYILLSLSLSRSIDFRAAQTPPLTTLRPSRVHIAYDGCPVSSCLIQLVFV